MLKGGLVFLLVTMLMLVSGTILVKSDINDVTTYFHSGQEALSKVEYGKFKEDVATYGINVRPSELSVMNSGDSVLILLERMEATKDLSVGNSKSYTREADMGIAELQLGLIIFGIIGSIVGIFWVICVWGVQS